MTIKHTVFVLFILFIIFMMGCAGGISRQSRDMVTYKGPFAELQNTPDDYKGEVVMLGGRIIEANASSSLSKLIILQIDLNSAHRPEDADQSHGRFIVQAEKILDPEIYQKGMMITVVGTLKGSKALSIGGFNYTYPIVEPIEIKLWPKDRQNRPAVHFGFGIGTSF